MRGPLAGDLDDIVATTRPLWEALRGERIFITGGTGFIGCWLLESFIAANDLLSLGASAHVLTRDPAAFARRAPHLATNANVHLHGGDVRTFDVPAGRFAAVVHAAAEVAIPDGVAGPRLALDTIMEGTRRVLAMARAAGASRVLHTSSGAVYGRQPAEIARLTEDYPGAPRTDDPRSVYGEGKRLAELLCTLSVHEHGLHTVNARCFAFIGPYLPADGSYAAGNFLRDRLDGGPIRVRGDGSARRSYLYAADLATWLWTLLFAGQAGRSYNVGSEEEVSIAELADLTARAGGGGRSHVELGVAPVPDVPAERYVPSTARAAGELGLRARVALPDALERTLKWNRARTSP